MRCAKCEQERKRNDLGINLEDNKLYCLYHEDVDIIPLSDTERIAEETDNQLVKKLIGKTISFRLTPDKVFLFAKMFQEQGHDTINGAVNALLDEHLERNDYYEDVILEQIEYKGKRSRQERKLIINDFIAPKDEELKEKAEVEELPEEKPRVTIDIDDLDLDLEEPEQEEEIPVTEEDGEDEFVL